MSENADFEIDISFVLPCLNEEQTVGKCVAAALGAISELNRRHGLTGEVVVVDNGSTDQSAELAAEAGAKVVHESQNGYGAALLAGFRAASGRILVMADADATYDLSEAVEMVEKLISGDEMCMGSRFRGSILPGAMPWKNRVIGNPVLTGILNLFFRSGFTDAHCGLRAFTREALDRIAPVATGMEFASELVVRAALLKLKCSEVPITLHPGGAQRNPHLRPWRDGLRHLRYLVQARLSSGR